MQRGACPLLALSGHTIALLRAQLDHKHGALHRDVA